VAEVDGDAGLLLLHVAGRRLGGGALADVAAGVLEGGLGQGHDLVVRDGRGGVVAHCGREKRGPGGAAAASVADMLRAGESGERGARTGRTARVTGRMMSPAAQQGALLTSLARLYPWCA
jgi:hypothetical protein